MLKIVFMGTPAFSVPILEALIEKYNVVGVVTQPDKLTGRHQEITMSKVKECALKHNIPVFQPEKIRKDYQNIIDLEPDVIITAAYGQIVGTNLLFAPKYKSINVHGSLLPKYRGGAPIQRAIMNGEKETGITIMYMAKGMDSGDILTKASIPIDDEDNTETLFAKLSFLGRDLLMESLPLIIDGTIKPVVQNEEEVTFAYNLTPEEEIIDFNKDASCVHNQIRALAPLPGAYMMLKDEKLKIFKSKVTDLRHDEENGKIINVTKKGFMIACGNHTVLDILEVQPSGKKRMLARDFANGALRKYL